MEDLIKEMPIEERYDNLTNLFVRVYATCYAFIKEMGLEDKFADFYMKVYERVLPSPKSFKQFMDEFGYVQQVFTPVSDIELTRVSDRESTVTVKSCPVFIRMKEFVKKAGLDVDPVFLCKRIRERYERLLPELVEEPNAEMTVEFTESGCVYTAKLK